VVEIYTPEQQYERAMRAIALELPEPVYRDFTAIVRDRVATLEARIADLECQPLVLITQRLAYAKALVDAQLCDAAEAERRALRTYPSPAERNS
jgi:hypothetical protein